MGSYSLNPATMRQPIGVTPVNLGGAVNTGSETTTPLRRTTDQSATTTPTTTTLAADLSGCHPASNAEILAPRAYNVVIKRGADGITYACPRVVAPVTPVNDVTVNPARRTPVSGRIVRRNPDGTTVDPYNPNGEQVNSLGEFQWPEELQALYNILISRGGELLNNPGYSDEALAYAFGNDFEKIRQQEAAAREQMLNTQSSQGMLGTGAAANQLSDLAWGTEGDLAQRMRDIFVQNEAQKRQDMSLGQSFFGTGMEWSKALEAINAARRGEGSAALMILLQLLGIMKG